MTDKKPKTLAPQIFGTPSEPPILWDLLDDHEAETAQADVADDGQRSAERLPEFSDEYDLSLVDEEREARRLARS